MHSRFVYAALVASLALSACSTDELPTAPPSLKRSSAQSARHIVLFEQTAAVPASFAGRVAKLGGSVVSATDAGVAIVSGLSTGAAAQLARDAGVAEVTPDFEIQLAPSERAFLGAVDPELASPTNPATAIVYRNLGMQWSYRVIQMSDAWLGGGGNLGSDQVTVAILDTGIDPTHVDMAGRVDDATSISFADSDLPLIAQFFPGAKPYTDLNGHGTHVANTVASNSILFAGMSTQTKLMAVKVLGQSGSGTFSAILEGVRHAVQNGADVINMSLGATFTKAGAGGLGGALDRTMKWAWKQGVTVVVAAGNDAHAMNLFHNNVYFGLCETKNVICVSATGPATGNFFPQYNPFLPLPTGVAFDQLAFFSNFGDDVDVAAPGGNYTVQVINGNPVAVAGHLIAQACSRTTLDLSGEEPATPCLNANLISGQAGTSQASPHVAGLAALLLAKNPNLTPDQVRAAIFNSADDRGDPGVDPKFGGGRINAARALGVIP